MKKILSGTVSRVLLASLLICTAIFSIGIWVPQIQSLIYQNDLNSNWFSFLWQSIKTDTMLGISLISELIISVSGGIITLSLVIPIAKIFLSKNFASSKRMFVDKFTSLAIIFSLSIIQESSTSFQSISNPSNTSFITFILSIVVALCFIGYIILFFILNKIQKNVVKNIDKKENNKTSTTEFDQNLDKIAKLRILLDDGAITQSEFDSKKTQLLNTIK